MLGASLPTELVILGLSVLWLFVHIAAQSMAVTQERGLAWNMGSRDGAPAPLGPRAGRAQRALANYGETWPALIALALGLAVTGRTGGIGAAGAVLWFAGRVAYLPLYVYGVKYWRTIAYMASVAGLLLMLVRLL